MDFVRSKSWLTDLLLVLLWSKLQKVPFNPRNYIWKTIQSTNLSQSYFQIIYFFFIHYLTSEFCYSTCFIISSHDLAYCSSLAQQATFYNATPYGTVCIFGIYLISASSETARALDLRSFLLYIQFRSLNTYHSIIIPHTQRKRLNY